MAKKSQQELWEQRIQHIFPKPDFTGNGFSRTHLWPEKTGQTEARVTKVVFSYSWVKKRREPVHIPHTHTHTQNERRDGARKHPAVL